MIYSLNNILGRFPYRGTEKSTQILFCWKTRFYKTGVNAFVIHILLSCSITLEKKLISFQKSFISKLSEALGDIRNTVPKIPEEAIPFIEDQCLSILDPEFVSLSHGFLLRVTSCLLHLQDSWKAERRGKREGFLWMRFFGGGKLFLVTSAFITLKLYMSTFSCLGVSCVFIRAHGCPRK